MDCGSPDGPPPHGAFWRDKASYQGPLRGVRYLQQTDFCGEKVETTENVNKVPSESSTAQQQPSSQKLNLKVQQRISTEKVSFPVKSSTQAMGLSNIERPSTPSPSGSSAHVSLTQILSSPVVEMNYQDVPSSHCAVDNEEVPVNYSARSATRSSPASRSRPDGEAHPINAASAPSTPPFHPGTGDRHLVSLLQQLDKERSTNLSELGNEQRLQQWFQVSPHDLQLPERPASHRIDVPSHRHGSPSSRASFHSAIGPVSSPFEGTIKKQHTWPLHKCPLNEKSIMAGPSQWLPLNQSSCDRIQNGVPTLHQHQGEGVPPRCDSPAPENFQNHIRNGGTGPRDISPTLEEPRSVRETDLSSVFHGDWPIDRVLWRSLPSSIGEKDSLSGLLDQETGSIMSFNSGMSSSYYGSRRSHGQLTSKVEVMYSLLSMMGSQDKEEVSRTLLAMSASQDSCIAMRQSGCLPLLIQLLHGTIEADSSISQENLVALRQALRESRRRASQALHNIVHAHPDDKRSRREARVLRLLEQIRDYCDYLRDVECGTVESNQNETSDQHPGPAIAALMKLSFDEEHRHAMCQLGGLQAIAELIQVDNEVHGNTSDHYCVTLRRYAGMALTNLTFGDGTNKALLCSMRPFMKALVAQLHSPSEDLRQVTASVLRNLSWRADSTSREVLREVNAVVTLVKAAMEANKEATLKSILSALWNLSAHCTANKADICAVDGALAFLVGTLSYKSQSKTLAIVENGGGILRNISSYIAVQEDSRAILRKYNCLNILLQQLKSPSLTVVSNACGTLWNLSARCPEDQQALWEMGAVGMLKNLVHSKHKMISMGSSAALKNLLSARPPGMPLRLNGALDSSQQTLNGVNNNNNNNITNNNNNNMPSLLARKQRALEEEIDQNLSETCDNIDSPKTSPTHHIENRFLFGNGVYSDSLQGFHVYLPGRMYHSVSGHVPRSDSRDSIGSTHSEPTHFRPPRSIFSRQVKHSALEKYNKSEWRSSVGCPQPFTSEVPASQSNLNNSVLNGSVNTHLPDGRFKASRYPSNLPVKGKSVHTDENTCTPGNVDADVATTGLPVSSSYSQSRGSSYHFQKYMARKIEAIHLSDQEIQDQPINFSLKYSDERNSSTSKENDCSAESVIPIIDNFVTAKPEEQEQDSAVSERTCKIVKDDNINRGLNFNSYAETDLDNFDQPTDYSQKYKEHMDSFEDFEVSQELGDEPKSLFEHTGKPASFQDDTLKVYCTEGTPLYISTASSLTDLRDLSNGTNTGDQSAGSLKTPEKRISIGELQKPKEGQIEEKEENECEDQSPCTLETSDALTEDCEDMEKKIASSAEKEVGSKTVTFGTDVNFAEETPLMFSRCSSLGSLSSFDQHSVHDDRSSVISDFSRRTSGIISPSDLPDSPSQTLPPSPRRVTRQAVFTFTEKTSRNLEVEDGTKLPDNSTKATTGVFTDMRKTYSEEDTPIDGSYATSLSSLTIDEPKIEKDPELKRHGRAKNMKEAEEFIDESTSSTFDAQSKVEQLNEDAGDASDNEGNEDLLLTCINLGMPNNSSSGANNFNNSKLHSHVNNLTSAVSPRTSGIPVKASNLRMPSSLPAMAGASAAADSVRNPPSTSCFAEDTVKVYHTEDTPANLSHAASFSDLSNLSFETGKQHELSFNNSRNSENHSDSSSLCDDNDNILQQCIRSGMPDPESSSKNLSMPVKSKLPVPKVQVESIQPMPIPQVPEVFKLSAAGQPRSAATPMPKRHSSHNCGFTHSPPAPSLHDYIHGKHKVKQQAAVRPIAASSQCHREVPMSHEDSTHCYQTEGTPVNFSSNVSLSSLSCDDDHDSTTSGTKDSVVPSRIPAPKRADGKSGVNYLQPKSHLPLRSRSSKPLHHPTDLAYCSSVSMPLHRHSPITESAQEDLVSPVTPSSQKSFIKPPSSTTANPDTTEVKQTFQVEGTPVCFSRNSSLSSLSVESLDEPSAADQALLEACISSGMPKERGSAPKSSPRSKSKTSDGSRFLDSEHISRFGKKTGESKSKKTESNLGVACGDAKADINIQEDEEKGKEDERAQEKNLLEPTKASQASACPEEEGTDAEKLNSGDSSSWNDCSPNASQVSSSKGQKSSSSGSFQNTVPQDPKKDALCTVTLDLQDTVDECSEATEIVKEANKVALKVESTLEEGSDELTQSSASCFSDLDNIKPPSIMGDNLSLSMTSSGLSEDVSGSPKASDGFRNGRRLSLKTNGRKIVPETVRRALGGSLESPKSYPGCDLLELVRPPSAMGSVENLSMRSSGTSELLDNINPPSTMDDLSLSGSYTSLNSLSTDGESKSSPLAAAPKIKSSHSAEMFERLNAAATMAQVYSRELNTIMNGSMKSSGTSEIIDHVKPPSAYQEITEVTVEDVTEFGSDGLASDTEFDEELPRDDDTPMPSTSTLRAPQISSLIREDQIGDSTENLVSTLVEAEPLESDDHVHDTVAETLNSKTDALSMNDIETLEEDAKLIVVTLNEMKSKASPEYITLLTGSEYMIEDETFSLVSNESDTEYHTEIIESVESTEKEDSLDSLDTASKPSPSKGPRIVKPINRDTIRQMQEKKESDKSIKPNKSKLRSMIPPPLKLTSRGQSPRHSPKHASQVKPTKTSALRASQNQRSSSFSRGSDTPSPQRTPVTKTAPCSPAPHNSSPSVSPRHSRSSYKNVPYNYATYTKSKPKETSSSVDTEVPDIDNIRPKGPIKQGTFTKDPPDPSSQESAESQSKSSGDKPSSKSPSIPSENLTQTNSSSQSKRSRETKSANSSPGLKRPPGKSPSVSSFSGEGNRRSSSSTFLRKKYTSEGIPQSPSSQSLGKGDEPKKIYHTRSMSSGGLGHPGNGVRSGSSASLSSQSTSSISSQKKPVPIKKDVQSRIASLWKKSENSQKETKTAQQTTSSSSKLPAAGKAAVKKGPEKSRGRSIKEVAAIPKEGLCRSSTYDKLTEVGLVNDDDSSNNSPQASTPSEESVNSSIQSVGDPKTDETNPPSSKGIIRPTGFWKKTSDSLSGARIGGSFMQKRSFMMSRKVADISPKQAITTSLPQHGKDLCESQPKARTPDGERSSLKSPKGYLIFPPMGESRTSPASAVVSPFNYTPKATTPTGVKANSPKSQIPGPLKFGSNVLQSRQSQYTNGVQQQEESSEERRACLVTTV